MDTSGETSRFEKSLGLLTTRFVNLLQAADYGILDLKLVMLVSSNVDSLLVAFANVWVVMIKNSLISFSEGVI